MSIKKISPNVRIAELADTSERLVRFFKQEDTLQNDVFLKNIISQIESQSQSLSTSIKRENAVSKLEETDKLRNEIIMNLNYILMGYRAMPSEEIKRNAEKLYMVFSKYGTKITRENYTSKSALIESLLRDFSSEDLRENISSLSFIRETLDEIRNRQNAFNSERMAYEKAIVQQNLTESASILKKPLLEIINKKLLSYLLAMEGNETYQHFINSVTQVIEDSNSLVQRRQKGKAN